MRRLEDRGAGQQYMDDKGSRGFSRGHLPSTNGGGLQHTVVPFQSHNRSSSTPNNELARLRNTRQTRRTRSPRPRDPGNPTRSRRQRAFSPLLYIVRLLIIGVGIGVLVGSLISTWSPNSQSLAGASRTAQSSNNRRSATNPPNTTTAVAGEEIKLAQELLPLKAEIQTLATGNTDLTAGVFLYDLDTGNYVDFNGTSTFSAASMIKVPILVAFFQDLDAGKIRLDEILTMEQSLIASGSGVMQFRPAGTKFTALETATKMIVVSDNTATNMLIQRLGGMAELNRRFQSWGMTATAIRNPLPDLEGTNTTRPRDLAELMVRISRGELISMRSRDRMLDIMRRTETDTLLPKGLEAEAEIFHKTGDIGSLVGDVGLIDAPNGRRYAAVAMVKRPHNDSRAQEMIRRISRAAYKVMGQPLPVAAPGASSSLPSPDAPQPESEQPTNRNQPRTQ